jgi:hypothetical protein
LVMLVQCWLLKPLVPRLLKPFVWPGITLLLTLTKKNVSSRAEVLF